MVTLSEVILQMTILPITKNPKSRDDFGGINSVGLKVRRTGKQFTQYADHDFGTYLGLYKEQFHIGTCEIVSFHPTKLESFNSLEELKKEWELD